MAADMLKTLENFPTQCADAFKLAADLKVSGVNNIVVAGMGGSVISGDLLLDLVDVKVPVIVNKSYALPKFVSKDSLVFVVSYSGNTAETVSCFKQAKKVGAKVITVTSGGKLARLAKENLVLVPAGLLPRTALGYLFFPILRILQNSGLIKNVEKEVEEISKLKADKKLARELASALSKKVPLIYSSLQAVAYRWKTQLNENAKAMAFSNALPELLHNELEGYKIKNAKFFALLLDFGDKKIKIEALVNLLLRRGILLRKLRFSGLRLVAGFKAILVGDLTSYYLALKYGVNPVETKTISALKK